MAIIYPKETTLGVKNCLILSPRDALSFPFNIGEWETARFAFYVSSTSATNENNNLIEYNESFPLDSVFDRVFMGVRPLSKQFPFINNDYFLGISNSNSWEFSRFYFQYSGYEGFNILNVPFQLMAPNGSVIIPDFTQSANRDFNLTETSNDSSSFCALVIFEAKIINKGLPNQQVKLRFKKENGVTDTSSAALQQKILSIDFGSSNQTIDFNNSGTPYTPPDSFFIYTPFANLRLRIHNIAAMKIS